MKDFIIRQSYDKGYDAGTADKAAGRPKGATACPYRPTRWENGRDGMWRQGYADGYDGHDRKLTHDEHYRQLAAFREAIVAAFAEYRLHCTCEGLSHDLDCPLGPLEIEAEALRAVRDERKHRPQQAELPQAQAQEGGVSA